MKKNNPVIEITKIFNEVEQALSEKNNNYNLIDAGMKIITIVKENSIENHSNSEESIFMTRKAVEISKLLLTHKKEYLDSKLEKFLNDLIQKYDI